MRITALLLGTCFTIAYGYAAQAAMTADRAEVMQRLAAGDSRPTASLASPVWNGGTLAPITVVASATPAPERASAEAARPKSDAPPAANQRRAQPPPRSAHTVRLS